MYKNKTIKKEPPYYPAIPLWVYIPKESKSAYSRDTFIPCLSWYCS
jgi:hypothetical protein